MDAERLAFECGICGKWWASHEQQRVHVLVAHPQSEEAEVELMVKAPLRVRPFDQPS